MLNLSAVPVHTGDAMKLSAETFQKITDSVAVVSRDEARPSDRRSPRVRLSTQLSVHRWDRPTEAISSQVRDLSAGGVGLLHNERVALDERLVVRFPMPAGQSVIIVGTVLYWEPLAEELFAIGVQFDRTLSEEEWTAHTQAPAAPATGVIGRVTQAVQKWRKAS
jgi:hypothetical protein